jgi:hypothetical protein
MPEGKQLFYRSLTKQHVPGSVSDIDATEHVQIIILSYQGRGQRREADMAFENNRGTY